MTSGFFLFTIILAFFFSANAASFFLLAISALESLTVFAGWDLAVPGVILLVDSPDSDSASASRLSSRFFCVLKTAEIRHHAIGSSLF